MNEDHYHERIRKGRAREESVLCHLANHGLDVRRSTRDEDRLQGVDAWIGPLSVQIKTRDDGARQDLGLEVFRPYHGLGHPDTRKGRDFRFPVPDLYAIPGPAGYGPEPAVLLADGHAVHRIIRAMIRCTGSAHWPLGSQLCQTTERGRDSAEHGTRKLMAYLSPDTLRRYAAPAL